jgi:hypothetical protein
VLCCAVCRRSCGTNALCLACVYVVCVQVASITPFSRYLPSHHTTHFSGCNGTKALPQLFNPNPSAQPLTHSLSILSILNYLLLSLTLFPSYLTLSLSLSHSLPHTIILAPTLLHSLLVTFPSLSSPPLGVTATHEVESTDDQFDQYRKRMMLAYRFRPNPLNNPRRDYY